MALKINKHPKDDMSEDSKNVDFDDDKSYDIEIDNEWMIKYKSTFLCQSGYLPKDINIINKFLKNLCKSLSLKKDAKYSPVIEELKDLAERNGIIKMLMTKMLKEIALRSQLQDISRGIWNIDGLYAALDHIINNVSPTFKYNKKTNKEQSITFPLSHLFVYMMLTPSGQELFRRTDFNNMLTKILQTWCIFLDKKKSTYSINDESNDKYDIGWLSPEARKKNKLNQFIVPKDGWDSYNAFFHREIKLELRPIGDGPIVSANDGSVIGISQNVKRMDKFWLKSQPYSLVNMLNGNEKWINTYIGGTVFQSFLSGSDYHRFHSPIKGTVVHVNVVRNCYFSELPWDTQIGGLSGGYGASVNTRGLCYIDSKDANIGIVCVMPIGITEISSVQWIKKDDKDTYSELKVGDEVEKGQEIGRFSYGGSSMCLIFEPGKIKNFVFDLKLKYNTLDINETIAIPIKVRQNIAELC